MPLRIESDFEGEDSAENPQRRACLRGYGQINWLLSPARLKYPMKRKSWSPENPNGQLRGIDEWERITWDEALDIVATQSKRIIDTYGGRSILISGYINNSLHLFDPIISNFLVMGAGVPIVGTISLGAWALPALFMTGEATAAPDMISLLKSDLHVLYGCNWAANKAGNVTYHLAYAREKGAKVIIIDPWFNRTAQVIADEWVPIKPGTDTAFTLGMMYHMIQNDLYDQAYLDKYCYGFDAEHMPPGAPAEGNFKDYVLGTYDGTPKTPEWAETISGVPAATTRRIAEQIATTKNVNFFGGQSVTKIPAGEMFAQAFYTLALMHGGLGGEGTYASWIGHNEHNYSAVKYAKPGANTNAFGTNPVPTLMPPNIPGTSVVLWPSLQEGQEWEMLDCSECWQNVLDEEYGRDSWPGGKRPLDIHMIYSGGCANYFNQMPNANAAIKAFRKVDFVVASDPYFTPPVQYADIVLPISARWEKGNVAWQYNSDAVFWMDKVVEPMYEAKSERWVANQLAERFGLNPREVVTMTDEEVTYYSLKDSAYLVDADTREYAPLLTMTQADIDAIGVQGEPQEGLITLEEFKKKGYFKQTRSVGDKICTWPYKKYYEDPENAPLGTPTGKFEIYCATLAGTVNMMGYSKIDPVAKWQTDPYQGVGAQTDEYPLLLWTPHSLRRGHSNNDTVISLREAFPQECFISPIDAEARGIKSGDPVLMTSPYGKVLRPAKVTPIVAPGAVALEEGAWLRIDEETGIDLAGNPNILQAPASAGEGLQAWTGTIVQVEKYTGSLKLVPDKICPVRTPGVEE